MSRVRRLGTLRARVTLAFAAATAAVLVLVGLAVFVLFSVGVTGSIDSGLRQRQYALQALAGRVAGPAVLRDRSGERLLQLYRPDGRLVPAGAPLPGPRLLRPAAVSRAVRDGASFAEAETLPGAPGDEARLRVFRLRRLGLVAVIGESLEGEHHLRLRLAVLLALAIPLAVLVACWLGYRLAGAALGPVERMRRRAEQITEGDLSQRLPLPDAQDEIARLGRTFNALLDRLARAFARERRIVSDASHELRTPLAVLQAELQVAARPDRTPEQRQEAIVSALEETRRLGRLADDLLVLARQDAGQLPLRREPVDVRGLLRDLERRHRTAAGDRPLDVGDEVPGGAVLDADPDRLAQALDNLVVNALRHGDGPVRVRARPGGDGRVALSVQDAGPGFGPTLPRAFERFSQGDASRAGAGSGLGLAIVQAIVAAHGGEVRAEDPVEGGARVTLLLPAA